MLATQVRRWVLVLGTGVFLAVGALLYATGHTAVHPSEDYAYGRLWSLWVPVAIGILLVRLLPWRTPEEDLDVKVRAALTGHPMRREVLVLLGCVVGAHLGDIVLDAAFGMVDPSLRALSYHTAKVLFLLVVPLAIMGSAGVMRYGHGPDIPAVAMRVGEGWRWAGLAAVAGYLLLSVLAPWTTPLPTPRTLPDEYSLAVRLLLTFTTSALLEEVFYRGMLQTRLELLLGRWPGIVAAALVYGIGAAVGTHVYPDPAVNLGMGIAVQGVTGLLFGYLWSRYRNLWLNFLLHTGVSALPVLPLLSEAVVLWTG
ncbi:CPBP family intramembrane glutamic endopeptidase [Marinactinospora rubrisoli]|uniref:CPBP family intramembrane glutamic endopeptidase n=1 Tax=Marinactinospora rubrisoli TaxID=2715399 RepID=A0ABW2KB43_9ACTN